MEEFELQDAFKQYIESNLRETLFTLRYYPKLMIEWTKTRGPQHLKAFLTPEAFYLLSIPNNTLMAIRDRFPKMDAVTKNYIHLCLKEYRQASKTLRMGRCFIPFDSYAEFTRVHDDFNGAFLPTKYTPVFKNDPQDFSALVQLLPWEEIRFEPADAEALVKVVDKSHHDDIWHSVRRTNPCAFQYLSLDAMLEYYKTVGDDEVLVLYSALKHKRFVKEKVFSNKYFYNPKTNFFVDACRARDYKLVRQISIQAIEDVIIEIYPTDKDLIKWLVDMNLNVKVIMNQKLYQLIIKKKKPKLNIDIMFSLLKYSDSYYLRYYAISNNLLSKQEQKKLCPNYPFTLQRLVKKDIFLDMIDNGLGTKFFLVEKPNKPCLNQYSNLDDILKDYNSTKNDELLVLYNALKYKDFYPQKIFSNSIANFFVDFCRARDKIIKQIGIQSIEDIQIEIFMDDIELIYWLVEMELKIKVIITNVTFQLVF